MTGMKQADLARSAGISASYLNLIEHNRRRIGGKLLLDIAGILGVEPALLTEGAEATLIATLREAASDRPKAGAETDRADEFAGRFPGWARLLAEAHGRIAALERSVETLTDRMAHDPHLAASLHEMISTVTSIRSSASILAEPGDLDREWRERFHRNIREDSTRLAEASRGLVAYLEASGDAAAETGAPQEEVDAALDAVDHHLPQLEAGGAPEEVAAALGEGLSVTARALLEDWCRRYAADVAALPMARLVTEMEAQGPDPAALSEVLGADPALVMRRLAALPREVMADRLGLAICDASGVLIFRRPLPDFPMPRFGAACPLWPLYRALARPMVVVSAPLAQPGRAPTLWADAVAVPRDGPGRGRDPVWQAHMLIRPIPPEPPTADAPQEVGVDCRICPRQDCPARREPSILGGAGPSRF
ncbi:hypothetical protein C8N44_1287 [Allosediminivita pacifica]|uniref:HTH cro/C1-type domain-containing protein n=2 Tax=Allosediminivita pacifica TaxID=1267769 RepID=A0A2T6ACG9_9RHOB|nr:hypothetical protein C8N44_1287 [Allosediminivita pacifica]